MALSTPPSAAISCFVWEQSIVVRSPYAEKPRCQAIPGGRWNDVVRGWQYPQSPHVVNAIMKTWGDRVTVTDEVLGILAPTEIPSMPHHKFTPRHYQESAYRFAYRMPGAMLAMDMGTGKTFTAIALLNAWNCGRVLVLCPASVLSVWASEFAKHSAVPYHVETLDTGTVVDQVQAAATALSRYQRCVIVQNYEAAIYGVFVRRQLQSRPFQDWAVAQAWDAVVVDESHRIGNGLSVTADFCNLLRDRAAHRLCLTGTPMAHSFMDVFNQCRFLDPGLFGFSYLKFRDRYAIMGGWQGREIVGSQNEPELQEKFYSIAYRVMADDVLSLPESTHVERTFRLSPKAVAAYSNVKVAIRKELRGGLNVANFAVRLIRLQQITSGYYYDGEQAHEVDTGKIDLLKDVFEDIPDDEPVVIFCRFVHDVVAVGQLCEHLKPKRKVSYLYGGANGLKDWQAGKTDVLVLQIQAGSVGIDLTRACYTIYFSLTFSLIDFQQSLARTRRSGQTRPTMFIHLVAEGTIDERIYAALAEKKEVVDYILETEFS